MVIHGEPPAWRKKPRFVGPKLDFEGSLYDSHGMTERPINFDLDDEVAKRTEQLLRDMYGRTISLLRRHHAALLKTIKVATFCCDMELGFLLSYAKPGTIFPDGFAGSS